MSRYIETSEATAVIADYFDLICDTEYGFDETEILRRMNANAIDAVPVKHGKWIPVSERLPETYGEYIVTRKAEYGIKTKTSLYYENGIWWPPEEVIAWMDLPEPYKDPNNDD